jgi:hypothetical protein
MESHILALKKAIDISKLNWYFKYQLVLQIVNTNWFKYQLVLPIPIGSNTNWHFKYQLVLQIPWVTIHQEEEEQQSGYKSRAKVGVFLVWHKPPQIWNGSWPSSSGLRSHTILKLADHALFKMVRYVLLWPLRPELDGQDPFKICGGLCQTRKTPTLALRATRVYHLLCCSCSCSSCWGVINQKGEAE